MSVPRDGKGLIGDEMSLAGSGAGADYAAALLRSVGSRVERKDGPRDPDPALDWARSGAMALTGRADGPPLQAPGPLASAARGAIAALETLSGARRPLGIDGPNLLGEHAAAFGLRRRGAVAPGGTCRLLRAADGWIAVNLARPEDVASLPAWLGGAPDADAWRFAETHIGKQKAAALVERARMIGLPVAIATPPRSVAPPWFRIAATGPRRDGDPPPAPLVVDLSSLWAGPLCGDLLAHCGARVVKVESTRRPDGARRGPPAFFDLLNAGKSSVALDFGTDAGVTCLRELLRRADIVIESARPRGLAQLGIGAEALVEEGAGKSWVSITGYGRREPESGWVAFGDDAAVAAGLATATGAPDEPTFCGDAIADPLTGLHAAVAAMAAWKGGGGVLLDLSLCDVTAHASAFDVKSAAAEVRPLSGRDGWAVVAEGERVVVAAPRARTKAGAAAALGADTESVLADLGIAC